MTLAARHPAPALGAFRARTRDVHQHLEDTLLLSAPEAGREHYARHVAALWGWMKPTEAALWNGAWPATIEPAARAEKTSWLEADIAVARDAALLRDEVPLADVHPAPTTATRWGTAYVIEGSMLGGAVLLRRLGARLAPWPARYLHGYGPDAGRRWTDFLDALAAHVTAPADVEEAAAAARATFVAVGEWMRAHGAAR